MPAVDDFMKKLFPGGSPMPGGPAAVPMPDVTPDVPLAPMTPPTTPGQPNPAAALKLLQALLARRKKMRPGAAPDQGMAPPPGMLGRM